jgi:hypothetical protein
MRITTPNSTTRRALARIAAMTLPILAAAACGGTALDNSAQIGEIIGPVGSGTNGGTGGGGGSGAVDGTYDLHEVDGALLPDTLFSDSVEVPGDSTRVYVAVLDSARLSLDSGIAIEIDHLALRDVRATVTGGPQFNFTDLFYVDTISGAFADTSTAATSISIDFAGFFNSTPINYPPVVYAIAGDSLVGTFDYQLYDSTGFVNEALLSFDWKYEGAPFANEVTKPVATLAQVQALKAAALHILDGPSARLANPFMPSAELRQRIRAAMLHHRSASARMLRMAPHR